jgi:hypothetical protein
MRSATVICTRFYAVLLLLSTLALSSFSSDSVLIHSLLINFLILPDILPLQPLMQFGAFMRDEARDRGADALQVELSFNQKSILEVRTGALVHFLIHLEHSFRSPCTRSIICQLGDEHSHLSPIVAATCTLCYVTALPLPLTHFFFSPQTVLPLLTSFYPLLPLPPSLARSIYLGEC